MKQEISRKIFENSPNITLRVYDVQCEGADRESDEHCEWK